MLGPISKAIVHVDRMEEEVAFYRDVLRLEIDVANPHWTTFRTGACALALHAGGRIGKPNVRITFDVDDLDEVLAVLGAAGVETSPVREPAPGVRVADVRDPEGNVVSLEQHAL